MAAIQVFSKNSNYTVLTEYYEAYVRIYLVKPVFYNGLDVAQVMSAVVLY